MSTPVRQHVMIPGLPRGGAYADAVRHNDLVFLSGLVGVDGELRLAGEDAAAQTHQIMQSLKKVLEHFGASFSDVLKITTYLTDINDRAAVAETRKAYFVDALPAATLVAVTALALPTLKVEIDAVVAMP
jgi:2-iminobutanoate/2-iminopropanoate deaminase